MSNEKQPSKPSRGSRYGVKDFVRFTEAYLSSGSEAERRRFAGRVGQVTGFRLGASEPTVLFPKVGRLKEQKLYEVDSRRLEMAVVTESETTKAVKHFNAVGEHLIRMGVYRVGKAENPLFYESPLVRVSLIEHAGVHVMALFQRAERGDDLVHVKTFALTADAELDFKAISKAMASEERAASKAVEALPAASMSALSALASRPKPRQEFNPGVCGRLLREALVESVQMPSPYATHKGRNIEFFQITDAGRALLPANRR